MFYGVLLLGFLSGGVSVVSKALNYQAGRCLGTFNGSLINYLLAAPLSLVILLALGGGRLPVSGFLAAPWWAYLGGVCGGGGDGHQRLVVAQSHPFPVHHPAAGQPAGDLGDGGSSALRQDVAPKGGRGCAARGGGRLGPPDPAAGEQEKQAREHAAP